MAAILSRPLCSELHIDCCGSIFNIVLKQKPQVYVYMCIFFFSCTLLSQSLKQTQPPKIRLHIYQHLGTLVAATGTKTDMTIRRTSKKVVKMASILHIKNNAWVIMDRWFGNDFHEWWSHEWKSLPNRFKSDKNIIIHGNECIILLLTCYFMSWMHNSAKTIMDRWFRHCH